MLTERERQVLVMLTEGKRQKAIADEIGISHRTIRMHVINAVKRMGARTPEQAIALAIRGGEI